MDYNLYAKWPERTASRSRGVQAAKRFFRRALGRDNTRNPRTVVTDRLKSDPGALREMKRDGELWRFTRHRRGQWLNNLVEQDHRRIKRRTGPMLGFQNFWTARRTLAGIRRLTFASTGLPSWPSSGIVPVPVMRRRVCVLTPGVLGPACGAGIDTLDYGASAAGVSCRRRGWRRRLAGVPRGLCALYSDCRRAPCRSSRAANTFRLCGCDQRDWFRNTFENDFLLAKRLVGVPAKV